MNFIVSSATSAAPYITSQIGYILTYKKNLEKLENEVQRLEVTKTSVQRSVDVAGTKGEKIEDIVQIWLKNANDTVAKAKKLIDTDAGCCLGHCPNLWTRNRLSKKSEEMSPEISQVIEIGKFDRVSYRVPVEVTITPFYRGYEALESRKSMLNEIKEALKTPEMYMIGVHGMGGVGKSTLVNELAWQVKEDGSFGGVAIVTITSSPNVENIQNQIVDALLDGKLEKMTKEGRAVELHQRIRDQKKKVLIILDDIWSELNLTEVGIPFGDGCSLVVTSRDLNVLRRMGTQKDFYLSVLLEDDSWNLFDKVVGVVKESGVKLIAEKVAKCCSGLPLLIVTVAKSLRKKDVTAWKDALRQLESFHSEELHKKVYPTLELSYNWLEDDKLKDLFLIIGSFGLNDIHIEELFLYCCGLGFYDDMLTMTDARNKHHRLINDLRDSSLLLEGESEWVRMHDVVRVVATSLAPWYPVIFQWPVTDELNVREVKILDLYKMDFTPSLPHSLSLLINLCSLNLRKCNLGDIRMVGELTNLEILNLEQSSIQELPREIGHLTYLLLLNLTDCFELRVIPTNLLSSLTCLEELYMKGCDIEWDVVGGKSESNNASLDELQNLYKLTTLEISIRDSVVLPRDFQFPANLERYSIFIGGRFFWFSSELYSEARETSRTLMLTDSWWTIILLTTVENLSLIYLKGVKDVLYKLNDEGFPYLKHLYIRHSDELLHIVNSRGLVNPHSAFPNLETLVLDRLGYIEEIFHGPLPTQSVAKLKVIEVICCHRLKTIVPSYVLFQNLDRLMVHNCNGAVNIIMPSTTTSLPKLRILSIESCFELEEIFGTTNEDGEATLGEVVFMKLEELTLIMLPRLTSFSKGRSYNFKFPSLKMVHLRDCPMMETFCYGNLTTPRLTEVLHGKSEEYPWGPYGDVRVRLREEEYWHGDLNTTIRTLFDPFFTKNFDCSSTEYEDSIIEECGYY